MKEAIFSARKKDFRIDWFSGTGAGGQYRNRHPNCCRITHIASGLVATSQEERSRVANQKKAFRRLVAKLLDRYVHQPQKARFQAQQKTIRTYNEWDDRVVDHDTKKRYSYHHTVGAGDMSEIIEDRARSLCVAIQK